MTKTKRKPTPKPASQNPADCLMLVNYVLGLPQMTWHVRRLGRRDAFQAGCVGLAKACSKYDPAKGKFAGYVVRAIMTEIGREACAAGVIRLPEHMQRVKCGVDPRDRADYDNAAQSRRIMFVKFGPSYTPGCWDVLEKPKFPAVNKNAAQRVAALVDRLEPKYQNVIRHTFGLDGCAPAAPTEVARRLSLSRDGVSKQLKKALEILRCQSPPEPKPTESLAS